jgi:hypothetical protein
MISEHVLATLTSLCSALTEFCPEHGALMEVNTR